MRLFGVVIFILSMVYVRGYETTIIKQSVPSGTFKLMSVGSNIAIFQEAHYVDTIQHLYSVFEKNSETGKWENTSFTFDRSYFSGAGHQVDYAYPNFISVDDVVITNLYDSSDGGLGKVVRMAWNSNTKQFDPPVYSSSKISTGYTFLTSVSSDGTKLINRDSSGDVYTYYWDGSDWVSTESINESFGISFAKVFNDKILLGYESNTLSPQPSNTRGYVWYRKWDDVNNKWSPTEASFYPPSPSSGYSVIESCGRSAWMSDYFVVVYCPEADKGSTQSVGTYYTYRHDGTNWVSYGGYRSTQYAGASDRIGVVHGHGEYYTIVETDDEKFTLFDDRGNNIGGLQYTKEIEELYSSTLSYVTYVYNKVGVRYYYRDDDVVVMYNLEPTGIESRVPSITKFIDPETATQGGDFGLVVDIEGDYAAVCQPDIFLDGSPTEGAVHLYKRDLNTMEWNLVKSVGPGSQEGGVTTIEYCQNSMSFDGSMLVVSARTLDDNTNVNVGGIFIYDWNGTTLTLNTIKYMPVQNNGGFLGKNNLAVEGDVIAISDIYCDEGLSNIGCGYVFKRNGGVWDNGVSLERPSTVDANDYFGRYIDTDGTTVVVTSSNYGSSNPKGIVAVYTHNGTTWHLDQEILPPVSSLLGFGASVALDGLWMFVGCSDSDIIAYKKTGDTWVFHEVITLPEWSDEYNYGYIDKLSYNDPILAVSASNVWFASDGRSVVQMFLYNGTSWVNDQTERFRFKYPEGGVNSVIGEFIRTDGASIIVSEEAYDSNTGRVMVLPIFQPCTTSSQCPSDQYCGADEFCKDKKSCSSHGDCIGEFVSGRLPYCDSSTSTCSDIYEGTCSTGVECDLKVARILANARKLGSIGSTTYISNVTKAREFVSRVNTEFIATTGITQDLDIFVDGTEEVTINSDLFTNYGDDDTLMNHIKTIVCSESLANLCSIGMANRRLLRELQSEITVEVTYSIDSAIFESLVANGTSFSDESAFEQALAIALGVNTSDIVLSAASGTLVVEYVVSEEATGDDPLMEENLQALQDVESDLNTIVNAITTELDINPNSVNVQDVDYCAGRDCNNRGTCNPDTGICDCTDTDYWGVNCETLVNCNNGTKASGVAYCVCEYPEYGLRCENTKDCELCF